MGDLLELIAPSFWQDYRLLLWPPDVFAVTTVILHRSGNYTAVLEDWPPRLRNVPLAPRRAGTTEEPTTGLARWDAQIKHIGWEWGEFAAAVYLSRDVLDEEERALFVNQLGGRAWLRQLKSWWNVVRRSRHAPIFQAPNDVSIPLFHALLQLGAAADEACYGVGQPQPETSMQAAASDRLRFVSTNDSETGVSAHGAICSTLGWQVHSSRGIVLPKLHVPPTGLTVRALSHHLAFCPATEISPKWYVNHGAAPEHSVNLLVVPWPTEVWPDQFRACTPQEVGCELPERYGHFAFEPRPPADWQNKLIGLLNSALRQTGKVDGVILPELALRNEGEYQELVDRVKTRLQEVQTSSGSADGVPPSIFIVAGVGSEPHENGRAIKNKALCSLHLWENVPNEEGHWISSPSMEQSKQHSWRLEASQISNYSLGRQLDPSKNWWEHNKIGARDIVFVAWAEWLTLCTVICEDLARPDPLGELVRAVGPNLAIALLMDGRQLPHRWSGRHAVVLADDPGSAVLTLTSIGMVERSTPPDKPPSRVIALWKDPLHGAVEITLPKDAEALVLTLTRSLTEEWTADGRSDGGSAAYLTLTGVLPIRGGDAAGAAANPTVPAHSSAGPEPAILTPVG